VIQTWSAFRLTALEGRSGAEALGLSVAAVFMNKSRVQKMLREEVARLDGGWGMTGACPDADALRRPPPQVRHPIGDRAQRIRVARDPIVTVVTEQPAHLPGGLRELRAFIPRCARRVRCSDLVRRYDSPSYLASPRSASRCTMA
jgi:hypothetical protein